ncbi:MAG: hypothetical protein RsTaC01_1026 [Candidatus Paraimprobicoccus trichonymphae]|uniref:Lecithin:cholesterol acyltransferase n=1 Tax=Candidatus Paraimprobicoccus trichonymphae TaxID=3033793 RepID=A0AA48IHL5_9FIRM|nr:MAG: hypothetical protein RsTaC01_1026 [Candidatus Paraimprobicoccus trichonymphae]
MSCSVFNLNFHADSTENLSDTKKRAIIFAPGIGNSPLFLKDKIAFCDLSSKLNAFKNYRYLSDNPAINCDEDGVPVDPDVTCTLCDTGDHLSEYTSNVAKYGVGLICKNMLDMLQENFGSKGWKIVPFYYDFRLSNSVNGEILAELMNKYDEIILIGFSMGGLVISKALTLIDTRKTEIIKVITLGTPYYGSAYTYITFMYGMPMFNDKISNFLADKLTYFRARMRAFMINYLSMYEILPSFEFFNFFDGYIEGMETYEKTVEFLKTQEFNQKSDGTQKNLLEKAEKFHRSLYKDGEHIVKSFDYHFIASGSEHTLVKIKNNGEEVYTMGDGTVMLFSATQGADIYDKNRVSLIHSTHRNLLTCTESLKCVENIIKNKIENKIDNSNSAENDVENNKISSKISNANENSEIEVA